MHDRSAVDVISGEVEMLGEAMAEGAHSLGGVSWSAVDEMRAATETGCLCVFRPWPHTPPPGLLAFSRGLADSSLWAQDMAVQSAFPGISQIKVRLMLQVAQQRNPCAALSCGGHASVRCHPGSHSADI